MSVRLGVFSVLMVLCVGAVSADESRPPLPPMTLDLNESSYPGSARKENLQGRVLVEFSIDKRGRSDEEAIVHAEPEGTFDSAARSAVRKIKFTVPGDWVDRGGPTLRYRLSVLFKINPCRPPECVAPKAHPEADDFVIIGALAK